MDSNLKFNVFSRPHVRSRLERIMGGNQACITDKEYMKSLQSRMREEHDDKIWKRIRQREAMEIDREKKLILAGKMAVEDGPPELANHPGFMINQFTNKILEERRIKAAEQRQPKPSKLFNTVSNSLRSLTQESIKEGQEAKERPIVLEQEEIEKLEHLRRVALDIMSGNIFTQEDYDRIIYESPLVKKLRTLETVEEMYKLADIMIGPIVVKKKVIKHKFILG